MPLQDRFQEMLSKFQVLSHLKNVKKTSKQYCKQMTPSLYEMHFNDIMRMYAQSTYLLFASFYSQHWVRITDIIFDQKLHIPIQLYQRSYYSNKNMFETVLDHFEKIIETLLNNNVTKDKIKLFVEVIQCLKSQKFTLKQKNLFNFMKKLENMDFFKNNLIGVKIYSSSFVVYLHQQKNNIMNLSNEQMNTEESLLQQQPMQDYYQLFKLQEKEILNKISSATEINQINQMVRYSSIYLEDFLNYPFFRKFVQKQEKIEEETLELTQKWFKQLFYCYKNQKNTSFSLLNEQELQQIKKPLFKLGIKLRGHIEFRKCIQAQIKISLILDLNNVNFKYFKSIWEYIKNSLDQDYFYDLPKKKIYDFNPGSINVEYSQNHLTFLSKIRLQSIIHDIFKAIDYLKIIVVILDPLLRKLEDNIQNNFINLDETNFYYEQIKRLMTVYYRQIILFDIKQRQ